MMSTNESKEKDNKRLDKIKFEILKIEDENAKTKKYNNTEMVDKIRQVIKENVDGRLV